MTSKRPSPTFPTIPWPRAWPAVLAIVLLAGWVVVTTGNANAQARPTSSNVRSPFTPGGTVSPSSRSESAIAPAGSALKPIAKGDIIASLGNMNQVNEYTPSGTLVQTLMTPNQPAGMAFDGAGNLFVTEFGGNDILELKASTMTVSVFSSNTTLNDGTSYNAPESIAFGPGFTKMYVSDANRNGPGGGIHVVNATTGAGEGFYSLPTSSGSEGAGESDWLAFDNNARLFMTNENPTQGVMQVNQTTGDVVQPSLVPNLPDIGYGLSFDKNNDLWVGDTSSILEYSPNGTLLRTITNPNFNTVFAATFDASGNAFYAGDLSTGTLFTYSLDGTLQNSFNTGSGISGLAVSGAEVARTTRYVALGDSVPYGHGLANPDPVAHNGLPPDQPPSTLAYPSLVASALGYNLNASSRSSLCSLTGDQLSVSGAPMSATNVTGTWKDCKSPSPEPSVDPTELNAANIAANPPELVTIQAGADDIDFAGCLEYELGVPGIFGGKKCSNGNTVTFKVAVQLVEVTQSLEATIASIESQSNGLTKIAVVNYYQPIPSPSVFQSDGSQLCDLLALHKEHTYRHALIIQAGLNAAIAQAVAQYPGVTLVDISSLLGGPGSNVPAHQICTAQPWLFTGSLFDGVFWRALHPKLLGQVAIAKAVEAVVGPA
jgi:hypothetical protein